MLSTRRIVLGGYAALIAATVAVMALVVAGGHPSAAVPPTPPPPVAGASTPAAEPTAAPTAATAIFPRSGGEPQGDHPWLLVVGDSISFGLTVDPSRFGTNSSWAVQIQPMLQASGRPWSVDDLACPGETTVSYATGCPMSSLAPWLGGVSQRSAALAAVRTHRSTLRGIVVELGANDLLNARRDGTDPAAVLAGLRTRLAGIVADLSTQAPGVPLVVANVYDPYGPADTAAATAVSEANGVIAGVAASRGAAVADWHAAINGGAEPLATLVDQGHDDVHPTVEGHRLLAGAVMAAIAGGVHRPGNG